VAIDGYWMENKNPVAWCPLHVGTVTMSEKKGAEVLQPLSIFRFWSISLPSRFHCAPPLWLGGNVVRSVLGHFAVRGNVPGC